jgi:hypothetical protein
MKEAVSDFIANERRLMEQAAAELMCFERKVAIASSADIMSKRNSELPTQVESPTADTPSTARTPYEITQAALSPEELADQIQKRKDWLKQEKAKDFQLQRELKRKLRPSNKSGPEYDEDVPSGRTFTHTSLISMDEIERDA